jgi:manganese transport protein
MPSETISRSTLTEPSLPEVHSSVSLSRSHIPWRRLLGFLGPGFLISVGYMDPGNWATDIAGGSRFGYTLLFVIMASNLMAILLQSLSLKLGIATERDLAQLCREAYGRKVSFALWIFAEIAIAACDLAEVIGSAIALELLFHIPLFYGVLITSLDVLLILLLQRWGFRYVEALVIALIGIIIAMFGVQMFLSRPEYLPILHNLFIPSRAIVTDPLMLYIAIGILGATVMPHNLYLHSSIVQSRRYKRTPEGKREAVWMANIDSALALSIALFVNAAILVMAAAVFHRSGHYEVAAIQDAFKLLSPLVGAAGASTLFAIALLASRSELLDYRDAGRPGGDGGVHPHPSGSVAAAADYALAGDYSHHHCGCGHRRKGNGKTAHPEPGDSVVAVEFCGGAAGDVHRQPEADGRVCERALAARAVVVHGGSDCRAECVAVDRDGNGPLTSPTFPGGPKCSTAEIGCPSSFFSS